MAKREITIVIGTLNRPHVIGKLLKQLQACPLSENWEILVFDQSDKQNFELLQKQFPKSGNCRLIHLDQPNTCRYLNLGWQKATAPIVLYLDDDVEITSSTVGSHLKNYNNPKITGVAGRVINSSDPTDSDIKSVGKIKWYGAIFIKNFFSTVETAVDFPYGCNMSFRKEILKKCGGFDEGLQPPIYAYNEIDLGYRINKRFFRSIVFEPDALIYHRRYKGGGTRTFKVSEIAKSNAVNYGYFIGKNYNMWENAVYFFRRILFQLLMQPAEIGDILKGFLIAKKNKINRQNVIITGLFLLIAFLRFWKIPQFFNFTLAEEIQAFMSWEQVKHFHLVWIGVSAAYIKYYYGPGFLYLNALLFYITKDPVILGYFCFILSMVTVISLYHIVKELFSNRTAFFATAVYGCSTLINFHDRRFWTPSPVPFVTLWWLYSLIKAQKDSRWYIVTAILIGSAFHLHLQLLLLLFPTLISVIGNFKKIRISTWATMAAIYLILTSPLIVFDIVHNYDNLLMPIRVLAGKQHTELNSFTISAVISHTKEVISTLGRIWFLKLHTTLHDEVILESHFSKTPGQLWLSILSIVAYFWFFWKNRKPGYWIFFTALVILPLSYILYPSYNPEYYLMGFITLMTIAIGFWLQSLPKILADTIIIIFIIFNILTVITASDRYGLIVRKQLVQKTMTAIGNQNFYLDMRGAIVSDKNYYPYAGWRYLFKAYGRTPSQSSTDQLLGWLYPDEISSTKPPLKVIIVDTVKPKFPDKPLYIFQSGIYYAYIFKNE